jgi:uncharacterized Zn finger protein
MQACSKCGSAETSLVAQSTKPSLSIVRCNACGHLYGATTWVAPRPSVISISVPQGSVT